MVLHSSCFDFCCWILAKNTQYIVSNIPGKGISFSLFLKMDFAKLGFSGDLEQYKILQKAQLLAEKKNKLLVYHGTVPHTTAASSNPL